MGKLKWGVLSTAKIGLKNVIPAIQKASFCTVEAISSRKLEKAREAASQLGIPKAYGSYEELLADEEIDVIYNPLPNHLHVPWTLKALEAGKHVLCEKPIGLDAKEAQHLLDQTNKYPDLKVMEAFMYRFHPQWIQAKSWVNAGKIGQLKSVDSFFSYFNDNPGNIRNKPEMGGGGLMDIGCYCISAPRFIFGNEPISVEGELEIDPDFGTDRLASGVLRFKDGTATFTCATQLTPYQNVKIFGTQGYIEIPIPFNPPADEVTKIHLIADDEKEDFEVPATNHYTLQCDAFSKAILDDTPVPTPLEDAVANMKVIDALLAQKED